MINTGQTASPDHDCAWLPDPVSIGVLATWFPRDLVDAVIDEAGVRERRHRTLPARLMVYYVLALALFGGKGYVEVMTQLTDGLRWVAGGQWAWETATVPAIAKARSRLGAAPLALLFNRMAGPVATDRTDVAFWRELRVVSVGQLIAHLPDTPENTEFFGSLEADGASAGPRARLVALGEAGTGALLSAAFGPAEHPNALLAVPLVRQLDKTTVLVADLEFPAALLWRDTVVNGAELICQIETPATPPSGEVLADGTCLVSLPEVLGTPTPLATANSPDKRNALARMIECEVHTQGGRPTGETFALLTTLTDPAEAPAGELVTAFEGRWRAGAINDSLLAGQQRHIAFRSRRPDMVWQEMWATLCVYQRVRILMWEATHALALHEVKPPPPRVVRVRPTRCRPSD